MSSTDEIARRVQQYGACQAGGEHCYCRMLKQPPCERWYEKCCKCGMVRPVQFGRSIYSWCQNLPRLVVGPIGRTGNKPDPLYGPWQENMIICLALTLYLIGYMVGGWYGRSIFG